MFREASEPVDERVFNDSCIKGLGEWGVTTNTHTGIVKMRFPAARQLILIKDPICRH